MMQLIQVVIHESGSNIIPVVRAPTKTRDMMGDSQTERCVFIVFRKLVVQPVDHASIITPLLSSSLASSLTAIPFACQHDPQLV
jgi:hypothetical protein